MRGVLVRVDRLLRNLTPALLTVVLVILSALPLGLPGLPMVMPWLALMAVFYWTVHRPDLLPGGAVFLLGILQDAVSGTALGFHAALLLGVHWVVLTQRWVLYRKSFNVVWWGFSLVATGAAVGAWLLGSIIAWRIVDPNPVLLQLLLTIALYPPVAWLARRAHQTLEELP
jgi:rod shape-determining protein MreD